MALLRSEEKEQEYTEYRNSGALEDGCKLCQADSILEFNYWRIINNRFPYDKISRIHHMIVPKRHAKETELNQEEKFELRQIKIQPIGKDYDYIIEATVKNKSIPAHFHLHLVEVKEF